MWGAALAWGSARRGSGVGAGLASTRRGWGGIAAYARAGPQRCNRMRFNRIARRITLNRKRFNVCARPAPAGRRAPGRPSGVPAGAGPSVRRQTARTPTSVSSNARRMAPDGRASPRTCALTRSPTAAATLGNAPPMAPPRAARWLTGRTGATTVGALSKRFDNREGVAAAGHRPGGEPWHPVSASRASRLAAGGRCWPWPRRSRWSWPCPARPRRWRRRRSPSTAPAQAAPSTASARSAAAAATAGC